MGRAWAFVARWHARAGRAEVTVVALAILAIVAAVLTTGTHRGRPDPVGEQLAPVVPSYTRPIAATSTCLRIVKGADDGTLATWSAGFAFSSKTHGVIDSLPGAPRAVLATLNRTARAAGCTVTIRPVTRSSAQLSALGDQVYTQSLPGREGRVVSVGPDVLTDRLQVGLTTITTADRRDLYRRYGAAVEVTREARQSFGAGLAN